MTRPSAVEHVTVENDIACSAVFDEDHKTFEIPLNAEPEIVSDKRRDFLAEDVAVVVARVDDVPHVGDFDVARERDFVDAQRHFV